MDFTRIDALIGETARRRLQKSSVAVVGLGGVGSYVAEALCRSGVGTLYLVDADVVEKSNLNRQLPALMDTLGRKKTEVVAERCSKINPCCRIFYRSSFYEPGDFEAFFGEDATWESLSASSATEEKSAGKPEGDPAGFEGISAINSEGNSTENSAGKPDYLMDCIDSVPSKVDLLTEAFRRGIKLVSAMGSAGKVHPEYLRIDDIAKTKVCPLARSVRKNLRKNGIEKGIKVVYSTEENYKKPAAADEAAENAIDASGTAERRVLGTLLFVPASMGLLMANAVVMEIIEGTAD